MGIDFIWQDIVFMIGGFIFSGALIPTIIAKEKPAMSTCIMTGVVLAVFSVSYATLGLWGAFVSNSLTSSCWLTLFTQVVIRRKNGNNTVHSRSTRNVDSK